MPSSGGKSGSELNAVLAKAGKRQVVYQGMPCAYEHPERVSGDAPQTLVGSNVIREDTTIKLGYLGPRYHSG